MIEVLDILKSAEFPVIDFKFQNRGSGTALLWQFSVCVDTIEVDTSPLLRPFLEIKGKSDECKGALGISVRNDGWGSAEGVTVQVASPFRELFPSSYRANLPRIDSGQIAKSAIILSHEDINADSFRSLLRLPRTTFVGWPWEGVGEHEEESILVDAVEVEFSYVDSRSAVHKASACASNRWLPGNAGRLHMLRDCFVWNPIVADFVASVPTALYYVSLDLDGRVMRRQYPISHKIPPGDIEHFNIMLGSVKSCIATLWFEFTIDRDQVVKSEKFNVTISNPPTEHYDRKYRNGDELFSLSAQELTENHFPFLHAQLEHPCPHCGKPLRTRAAKQCRFCHADWHDSPLDM